LVGNSEVIQKRAYGKLARDCKPKQLFNLTKKTNSRSLLVATLVSFTLFLRTFASSRRNLSGPLADTRFPE
jgi:hypothetical protein